jgi:hypothetical protein
MNMNLAILVHSLLSTTLTCSSGILYLFRIPNIRARFTVSYARTKLTKSKYVSMLCGLLMFSAALKLCIACWHPLVANFSSTLFPDSTAKSLVEMIELITLEVSSFTKIPLQLLGSLVLPFSLYRAVRSIVCHTL